MPDLLDRIMLDSIIRSGKPVIRGTLLAHAALRAALKFAVTADIDQDRA